MTGGAWWRRTAAVVVASLLVVGTARAAAGEDEPPPQSTTLRATTVSPTTEARPVSGGAEIQLDQRWLPVESRTDLGNYAGLNVPGVSLAPGGAGLEIRGGSARDTATSLDGFRIAPLLVSPTALAGAEIYTAGYGADLADVPGGAIVARIQSPSNQLRVAADAFHDLRNPERNAASATVSGPLVRDRLFALVSINGDLWTERLSPDPLGLLPPPPRASGQGFSGAMKLAWRPHARHTVESVTIVGREGRENGASADVAPDAQPSAGDQALFTAIAWRAVGGRLSLRSQLGFFIGSADLEPMLCRREPEGCEVVAPRIDRIPRTFTSGNGLVRARWRTRAWEVVNGAELTGEPAASMTHTARLTSRLIFRSGSMSESIPTGAVDMFYGDIPDRRTEQVGGPGWALVESTSMRTSHSLDDRLALWGRLWINPGVALVTARVATPDGSVLQDVALTPHLGGAWDATGDQRTWLRASVHRRVGTHFEDVTAMAPGMAVRRTCRWDSAAQTFSRDCITDGGAQRRTVGLPCGASNARPDGLPCAVAPRLPPTWELTMGGGRELVPNLTLNLDLVHRRMSGLPVVRETNRVWNATGETTLGPYRTGRAGTVADWSTAEALGRRYLGATASLHKRAGLIRVLAAYTWSRLEVDQTDSSLMAPDSLQPFGVARGNFHGLRLLAAADLGRVLSAGLVYSYDRGGLEFRGGFRNIEPSIPGPKPNDPGDDRPWVAPESHRLNLQVRARARRLLPVDVDLYLDVINLLDFGAVLPDPTAPDFSAGHRVQEPRWFRVGAEWRY